MAEASGSQKNIIKGCRLRGQALLARGAFSEAEPEFARALEVAARVGNPPQLWKSYLALGDLRLAQGKPEDARRAYGEALGAIDRVAARLQDAAMRATFLESRYVQEVRKRA